MDFSRPTITDALELFEGNWWSVNRFNMYLIRFGLDEVVPETLGTKPTRIAKLASHFIKNPDLKGPDGSNAVLETIEFILKRTPGSPISAASLALTRSLQLDGYEIQSDGTLTSVLPATMLLAPRRTDVEELLSKFKFTDAVGHLQQGHAAHARGDWAAANGQIRTFIESLFEAFAQKLLPAPVPVTSHARREQLSKLSPPFIDPNLNEWDSTTTKKDGFVQGFWKLLHSNGSHPGLSDGDDCTFRLQVAYLVADRFLKRFKKRTSSLAP